MPTLRKLQPEEVTNLERKGSSVRSEIAQEYDAYLAEFQPNDYGEVVLGEGESKITVRNRLQAAAKRRSWVLNFKRVNGPLIRFKVEEENTHAEQNGDEATEVFGPTHSDEELALIA